MNISTTGRLLAALPGAALAALCFGAALARNLALAPRDAVDAGTLAVVLAWTILSALAIALRSAFAAWAIMLSVALLSGLWAWIV